MSNKGWVPYPRYIFRKELTVPLVKKYVPKGARFLDVGCAAGDFAITLAKNGYTGIMIDFSSEAAKEANRNLRKERLEKVRFEQKDLLEIDTAEKFDLITMFEVLEHIENDKEALKRVNSLLREGGIFLFSVPSKAKLWGESDIIGGHFRRYDKDELIHLVNESEFEVLEFISYGFPWLNIAKFIRDRLARRALNQEKGKSKISLSKQSGLNIVAHRIPWLEAFFNRFFLFLPMKISNLFNNKDWAEGYLCLAKKRNTGYQGRRKIRSF